MKSVLVQQAIHPVTHLTGRFVCEGDGEDVVGRDSEIRDEMGYPNRDHTGLSGTCSCQNKQRSLGRFHGRPLLGVECVERFHPVRRLFYECLDLLEVWMFRIPHTLEKDGLDCGDDHPCVAKTIQSGDAVVLES